MSTELNLLAWSVVLGLLQLVTAAGLANGIQRGLVWGMGSRDEPKPPLTGMAGRLDRAFRNFLETFPLFAAAVLAAHASGRHNTLTVWGAELYFWGRVAYVPLYASGVFLVRSTVWGVSLVGIGLVLAGLLVS